MPANARKRSHASQQTSLRSDATLRSAQKEFVITSGRVGVRTAYALGALTHKQTRKRINGTQLSDRSVHSARVGELSLNSAITGGIFFPVQLASSIVPGFFASFRKSVLAIP